MPATEPTGRGHVFTTYGRLSCRHNTGVTPVTKRAAILDNRLIATRHRRTLREAKAALVLPGRLSALLAAGGLLAAMVGVVSTVTMTG